MQLCTRFAAARTVAFLSLAAASLPALAVGGTISGKVEATPAKYLSETVVYLKSVPGTHTPKTYSMDQKKLTFLPHILAITVGDTVNFLNHDTVAHSVYSSDVDPYNLGAFQPNQTASRTFSKPGAYAQLCSIHPEMLAYIFVGENPYSAVVDKEGRYAIKNVPPGTYQLAVWNSHLKAPEKSVTVAEGKPVQENLELKR